jgi:hypothetical protein
MLALIIVSILATVVAIGAYQLLINKYYWGPKGPPEKRDHHEDTRPK